MTQRQKIKQLKALLNEQPNGTAFLATLDSDGQLLDLAEKIAAIMNGTSAR